MRGNWSTRLFAWTLALYPRELRERFGGEMELVFEEQLAEACRDGGVLNAMRVWQSVLAELVTVALPNRLAPVAVPAIAVVMTLIWFIGLIGLIPLARAR